jgi:glutaredoxin
MAIKTKTKIKIEIGILLIIATIFLLMSTPRQKVDIIYFRNDKCIITTQSDRIMGEVKTDFNNKIRVKEINVNMYPEDKPDTEEVKELRSKYGVFGVPVIIINGKEFARELTKNNLENEICSKFIIKPRVCQ